MIPNRFARKLPPLGCLQRLVFEEFFSVDVTVFGWVILCKRRVQISASGVRIYFPEAFAFRTNYKWLLRKAEFWGLTGGQIILCDARAGGYYRHKADSCIEFLRGEVS